MKNNLVVVIKAKFEEYIDSQTKNPTSNLPFFTPSLLSSVFKNSPSVGTRCHLCFCCHHIVGSLFDSEIRIQFLIQKQTNFVIIAPLNCCIEQYLKMNFAFKLLKKQTLILVVVPCRTTSLKETFNVTLMLNHLCRLLFKVNTTFPTEH